MLILGHPADGKGGPRKNWPGRIGPTISLQKVAGQNMRFPVGKANARSIARVDQPPPHCNRAPHYFYVLVSLYT